MLVAQRDGLVLFTGSRESHLPGMGQAGIHQVGGICQRLDGGGIEREIQVHSCRFCGTDGLGEALGDDIGGGFQSQCRRADQQEGDQTNCQQGNHTAHPRRTPGEQHIQPDDDQDQGPEAAQHAPREGRDEVKAPQQPQHAQSNQQDGPE